jgi:8-oxo-dGTP diphosphatase
MLSPTRHQLVDLQPLPNPAAVRTPGGFRVKKQIDVVGAVIVSEGLVLCAQRGPGGHLAGLWEFPGGKIEAGESPSEALQREIREELGCVVLVGKQVISTTHEYDFGTVVLTTFYCRLSDGNPVPSEHQEIVWLLPDQLESLNWAPADVPAINAIKAELIPR